MDLIGDGVNVIHEASGVHIPMRDYGAVTFVSFLAAGTQSLTVDESIAGASGQNLTGAVDRFYKCPGIGGTWTRVNQAASDTVTNSDATNDMIAFTVFASQLSDGFDSVEVTAATGTCIAILHDGKHSRDAANLPSSV